MNQIFLVGGAKGVGKTSLINRVSEEGAIMAVSTSRFVDELKRLKDSEYLETEEVNEYLCQRLIALSGNDMVVDTHYATYPVSETPYRPFKRGMGRHQLERIAKVFDINLCLVSIEPKDLLKRREQDKRERIKDPVMISEELDYNKMAAEIYARDLGKRLMILKNDDFQDTKQSLLNWIELLRGTR